MEYTEWPASYNESVGELALSTWQRGIAHEVARLELRPEAVLDVGAGTGVGAVALRPLGTFHLVGLDRSAEMLAHLKDYDEVIVHDAATVDLGSRRFQLVVSGFDTVNYFDRESLAALFSLCAKHLDPSGLLIFDYSSPKLLREDWRNDSSEQELEHGSLRWTHHYDDAAERSHTSIQMLQNGTVIWSEDHYQYALDTYEMNCIARSSGLRVSRVRNLASDEFSPDANTHLYVLRLDSQEKR
jgi:predicted TPR repeat methyltransferase